MFYRMDLTDHAAMGQVFTRNEIQAVFHLGARVNVRESMQDPVGYAAVNVSASLALMELSRAAGVEQFVFISSGGAVYGEGIRPTAATRPSPKRIQSTRRTTTRPTSWPLNSI